MTISPSPATVKLVTEALQHQAALRQKAAGRAAVEVNADRLAGKKDIRSSAVRITDLLAGAGELEDIARQLAAGDLILAPPAPPEVIAPAADDSNKPETSAAAASLDVDLDDGDDADDDVEDVDLPGGIQ